MSHKDHKREQAAKQRKLIAEWKAKGCGLPQWAYKRSKPKKKR